MASNAPATPKTAGNVTAADVTQHPDYYLDFRSPGRAAAEQSTCDHDYLLTSSCPNCPAR